MTTEVVEEAASLIESGWTQFCNARDANGAPCSPHSKEATTRCAVGALMHALYMHDIADTDQATIMRRFAATVAPHVSSYEIEHYATHHIAAWNDELGRKASEVADAIRRIR